MKQDKKTQKITLSFTDAEREKIEQQAQEQQRNTSNYLYLIIKRAIL